MSKEHIRQVSPSDASVLKNFVTLERDLLSSNPLFVSEIDADVIKQLSGESAFFSEMEHALFVASGGGGDVARCAALINRRYQKAKNEAVGFIGYFAAAPDSGSQVQAMLEVAEAWLKERSVTRIIAPFNGAGPLGFGVRTAAFDEEPVYPFKWTPPITASIWLTPATDRLTLYGATPSIFLRINIKPLLAGLPGTIQSWCVPSIRSAGTKIWIYVGRLWTNQ